MDRYVWMKSCFIASFIESFVHSLVPVYTHIHIHIVGCEVRWVVADWCSLANHRERCGHCHGVISS